MSTFEREQKKICVEREVDENYEEEWRIKAHAHAHAHIKDETKTKLEWRTAPKHKIIHRALFNIGSFHFFYSVVILDKCNKNFWSIAKKKSWQRNEEKNIISIFFLRG